MFRAMSLLGILAAILTLALAGCDDFDGEKILGWDDAASRTQVQVKSKLHGGSMRVHMEITRDGKLARMVLNESVDLRLATLLRYNDWVLVLAGPYVLGGYDMNAGQIAPYNSGALPFTYHTYAGYPLDAKRIAEGDDPEPFNFQRRLDRP